MKKNFLVIFIALFILSTIAIVYYRFSISKFNKDAKFTTPIITASPYLDIENKDLNEDREDIKVVYENLL